MFIDSHRETGLTPNTMNTHDKALEHATRILRDTGLLDSLGYSSSQPRWRYFSNKRKSQDMYYWTSEKINHNGKPRYVSGIYKYKKKDQSWTPTKQVGHAKRKDAKARAAKFYNLANPKEA